VNEACLPGGIVAAVWGMASDKDADAFLAALAPDLVCPVAAGTPRSAAVGSLSAAAAALGVPVRESGTGAVSATLLHAIAREEPGTVVLVTGSFAVVAEAHVALGLAPG
jgi:folylpolyglutamate synthase/dihydropteroate synthase